MVNICYVLEACFTVGRNLTNLAITAIITGRLTWFLIYHTRVWTWVIGQTGIRKYMHLYRFSNPCLSDLPLPSPCTEVQRLSFVCSINEVIPCGTYRTSELYLRTSMEQKVVGKKVVGATPLFFRSLTLTPKYILEY